MTATWTQLATPQDGTADFSPYVLYRRGTLGLQALAGMSLARTRPAVTRWDETAAELEGRRRQLEDALHDAVPRLDGAGRRAVLAARRAVHGGRPVPDAGLLLPCLPPDVRRLVDGWQQACAVAAEAERTVREAHAADLADGRAVLARVAGHEDFQRGLQLSGPQMHREVTSYAADPAGTGRKASRSRRAESTIVSYAYRVALKPSPFGSFTEVGAQPWAPGEPRPAPGPAATVRRVRLSVGLVAWMCRQLARLDGSPDLMRVRLNNSLLVSGDRATFVTRPIEGWDDSYGSDRVVQARASELLHLVRGLLADGQRPERDVLAGLQRAGLSAESAESTLDTLVRAGLCHRGLGLPDQLPDPLPHVAALVRRSGVPLAGPVADVVDDMHDVEREYATATVARRGALLDRLRVAVERFADLCGCPAPSAEVMRSAVYEDLGTRAAAESWRPDVLERNRDGLALLQRLVPLLDDATVERSGLFAFADRQCPDGDVVPLVELFRRFSELPSEQASRVMCGVDDPRGPGLVRARAAVLDHLHALLVRDPAADEIRLDADDLTCLVDRVAAGVPAWRSAAYRVQFAEQDAGTRAVVNGITTGQGVFFSRYGDLLEPEDPRRWSLQRTVREHLAERFPRQTDITATLGLNFNLHPRLAPLELVYPGSVGRTGSHQQLTLADVVVHLDRRRRSLRLVVAADGEPVDLVPLNFLYPAAAPPLYRFLCVFAPTRTYRGGLWEQLERAGRAPMPATRPRLVLGDLVLARRSWVYPVGDVPALAELERHDPRGLRPFERWRAAAGLPRRCFFRVLTRPTPPADRRDLLEETRQWALEARSARLHKPHYLDVDNPFLLHVLAKQARARPSGWVRFEECLPDPEQHPTSRPVARAEEFFVELTRCDPGEAS